MEHGAHSVATHRKRALYERVHLDAIGLRNLQRCLDDTLAEVRVIDSDAYCRLTRIASVDAFKSRSRRGVLPLLNDDQRRGTGFMVEEAFLTILADGLHEDRRGVSLEKATEIAREAAPHIAALWADVIMVADRLEANDAAFASHEIHAAFIERPHGLASEPAVGTLEEIVAVASKTSMVRMTTVNVVRALNVLRARAKRARIVLPEESEWWSGAALRSTPKPAGKRWKLAMSTRASKKDRR